MSPLSKNYRELLDGLSTNSSPREVKDTINKIVKNGSPSEGTQLVRYSLIKSYLKTKNPAAAKLSKPPSKLINRVKESSSNRLREKPNRFIKREWIDEIQSWKDSDKLSEQIAWLQISSGRRISEIIRSDFNVEDNGKISSTNLSKKRTNDRCYFKLVPGVTSSEWKSKLEQVQETVKDRKGNSVMRLVNNHLKSKIDKGMSSHKMRGIYANLMWEHDGKKQNQTGFIQEALCLESQDVAIHYSSYVLQ